MDIAQQQDFKSVQPLLPSPEKPPQSKQNSSPFIEEYIKYMGFDDAELMRDELARRLRRHQIFEEKDSEQLISIVNVVPSKYCEIVEVDVQLGSFIVRIRIINIKGKSPLHGCECIGVGCFGKVYKYPSATSSRAVKCFEVKSVEYLNNYLFLAVVEYGFLKMASSIGCAPETKRDAFDLFVYKEEERSKGSEEAKHTYCIQFETECCSSDTSFIPADAQFLFKQLYSLHQLGITHCDIKSDNIMYSYSRKKWVFIDFGIATPVKQPIGQRSLSKYRGTYKYSGQEMKKLYSKMLVQKTNELQDYIDLYWNDVYGLRMSCEELQTKKIQKNEQIATLVKFNDTEAEQHFLLLQFKYCLYFTNVFQEQLYIKNIVWNEENRLDMVYFLFQIKFFPEKIRTVFRDFLKSHEIAGAQHTILENVLAEVKSTLHYDEKLMEMHQQQLKPKYLYFQGTSVMLKTCKASGYKLPSHDKDERNQIQNVLLYLKNYQYSEDRKEHWYYMATLFDSVNFLINKYNMNTQDKMEACKVFYELDHQGSQELSGVGYIQYFIEKAITACLQQPEFQLRQRLVQVYANYLMLGALNISIIKQVYGTIMEAGPNLSKICAYFLQIYNLNFWIEEQMLWKVDFDQKQLAEHVLSIMSQICQQLQGPQESSHKHCNKSSHVCSQLQASMLKTIQRHASLLSNRKTYEASFEHKIAGCLQILNRFKIGYDGTRQITYGVNQIPLNLRNLYVWQFYVLNQQSWARISFHMRNFIACPQITQRFSFMLKMEAFYRLYQNDMDIDGFLRECEEAFNGMLPAKNVQRMRAYYQVVVSEIYSQEKTMSFLQQKRDSFIKESHQVFEELGNRLDANELATLLVKMSQFDCRFIWHYMQLIKASQQQRTLNILHRFKGLIDDEACLLKKQHKLLKLNQFTIRNHITSLFLQSRHQSDILQSQQTNELLQIKLKFLEQTILTTQGSDQKAYYLLLFHEVMGRNERYMDFLVKNIYYTIYIDLIILLITSQRYPQAVSLIYKLSQNLLYLLSKQTSVLSKKIKDLLYDLFITQRADHFHHWTLFRHHFLQRVNKQSKKVLVFYNITIGLIDQAAYQLSKTFYQNGQLMLVLPKGFQFLDRNELRGLATHYSRLLVYQIPVYQIYQRENYYRLVSFLILNEKKHGHNKPRYKNFIARLHLKALLITLPIDIRNLFNCKKHLIMRKKHYHFIINIKQSARNYKKSIQGAAEKNYKYKIDQLVNPYQENITKKTIVSK